MTKTEYLELEPQQRRNHVVDKLQTIDSKELLRFMVLNYLDEDKDVDALFMTYLET